MTMSRKIFIVVNTFSGLGKAQSALKALQEELKNREIDSHAFLTPLGENMSEFIEENYPEDTTDVVVIGGDGTIYATLNVIYKRDVTFGVIPMGTGNDFVKTFETGNSLIEQVHTIIEGSVKLIDIGDCNGKKFANGVGLGFDGQVVYNNRSTNSLLTGHIKFYVLVLKILGSYRSRMVKFEIDNQKFEERILTMAIHNGTTFGGGFKLNPDGIIDDGLLNVCIISRMPIWKRFLNISRLSFGRHKSLKEVKFYTGRSIKVKKCDQILHAHIDGEYLGEPPIKIKVLKKQVRLRVKSENQL